MTLGMMSRNRVFAGMVSSCYSRRLTGEGSVSRSAYISPISRSHPNFKKRFEATSSSANGRRYASTIRFQSFTDQPHIP